MVSTRTMSCQGPHDLDSTYLINKSAHLYTISVPFSPYISLFLFLVILAGNILEKENMSPQKVLINEQPASDVDQIAVPISDEADREEVLRLLGTDPNS